MQTVYLENRDPNTVSKRKWRIGFFYTIILATLFWNVQYIAASFIPSLTLPGGLSETLSSFFIGLTLGGLLLLLIYSLAPHQLGLQVCYVSHGPGIIRWQLPGMKHPLSLDLQSLRACRALPDKLNLDTAAGPLVVPFTHLTYNDIQSIKKAFSSFITPRQ